MQEEQQSVSEILSSIRQVLSKEAATLKSEAPKETPKSYTDNEQNDVVFELTPQMQVSQGTLVDSETALRTQAALNKLQAVKEESPIAGQVETVLRPMLREWLNTNLPEIVERIVTQEVQRIINRR